MLPAPMQILIADDDPDVCALWAYVLHLFYPGVHIREATNGHMAHALYQQYEAHLIINDNCMPVMTGVELIGALRADGVQTPMVHTSSQQPLACDVAFDEATVFLVKPVCVHHMLDTVTHV